jgi:hypothetical protein
MTDDQNEDAEVRAFREKQRRFYALVGHCILRFQHVEDYLEDVFAAVLGGRRDRADAIFASVRGVERKIQIIRASATGLSGNPWDDLDSLLAKVKAASEVRGQIAHANPVQNGGLIRINVRMEGGQIVETVGMERVSESGFELHKQAAKVKIILTAEDLLREYNRIDKLFGDMIAFVNSAQNPPA